jgi:hypothetical protein
MAAVRLENDRLGDSVCQLMEELPKLENPTRSVEKGNRLNDASFASFWSSATLEGLSVFALVQYELLKDHVW